MLVFLTSLLAFTSSGSKTLRVCVNYLEKPNSQSLLELDTFVNQVYLKNLSFPDTKIAIIPFVQNSTGSVRNKMVLLGKLFTDTDCDAVIGSEDPASSDTVFISHYLRQSSKPICSLTSIDLDKTTRLLMNNLISVVPSSNLLTDKIASVIAQWGDFQIILDPYYVSLLSGLVPETINQIVIDRSSINFKNEIHSAVSTIAASKSNLVLYLGTEDVFSAIYDEILLTSPSLMGTIEWVLLSMTPIELNSYWRNVYILYPLNSVDSGRLTCLKSYISFYEYVEPILVNSNFNSVNISNINKVRFSDSSKFNSIGDLERAWQLLNTEDIATISEIEIRDLRLERGTTMFNTYKPQYIALLFFSFFFVIFTVVVSVVLLRKIRVKRSGILDMATLFGIVMGNLYVFASIPKPSDSNCQRSIWYLPIGLSIVLSTMITRSYRLYRIFGGAKLHSQKLNDSNLLLSVIGMVSVNVIILLVWTIADPMKPTINYQYLQLRCDSAYSGVFTGILVFYNGVLLIAAGLLANGTRKIVSEYTESTQLAWSVYNVALWSLISLPIQFSNGLDPLLRQMFNCVIVMIAINTFTVLLYGKTLIKTKNELNTSRPSSTASATSTFQKIGVANLANQVTANNDSKLFIHLADVCEPGVVNMYRRYLLIMSIEEKYIDIFELMNGQVNFSGRTFKLDLLEKFKIEEMKNGGTHLTMDHIHLYILFNGEELNANFKQTIRPFVQMKQNANMQAKM
eukprot:NODE_101_length_20473_cov_0.516590.p3 type:complete len:739 gc:universal NODE_101_length_20473_cov_0.516590:14522-16738(+)